MNSKSEDGVSRRRVWDGPYSPLSIPCSQPIKNSRGWILPKSSIYNMYGMDIWKRKCKYLSLMGEMVLLVDLSIRHKSGCLASNDFPWRLWCLTEYRLFSCIQYACDSLESTMCTFSFFFVRCSVSYHVPDDCASVFAILYLLRVTYISCVTKCCTISYP